jgi:hypothetical protein
MPLNLDECSDLSGWKELLTTAIDFLVSARIPPSDWAFGGGTVLMINYNHRVSKDVDIFVHDVQYLPRLSPRLNGLIEGHVDDYDEMSNVVKLTIGKQEIDFIAAPTLTEPGIAKGIFHERDILIELPEEIAVKKLFYRSDDLRTRDIFDLSIVLRHEYSSMKKQSAIFKHKTRHLLERIQFLKQKDYYRAVGELQITDASLIPGSIELVEDFLKELRPDNAPVGNEYLCP